MTLVRGTDLLNGPLWSLQWEVWFSILLPAFVLLSRVGRRAAAPKIVMMLGLVAIGTHFGHSSVRYLPAFGIGAVLASSTDDVHAFVAWVRRVPGGLWLLLAVAIALLDIQPIVVLIGHPHRAAQIQGLSAVGTTAGASLVVVLAVVASPVRTLCESRVASWLGRQSFSLYLVHEPIVVSVALLVRRGTSVWVIVAISVPLSLAAAWTFQRIVEGPAHELSRRVGRAAARLAAPATPSQPVRLA
jgi:peptidoglycan/LPS O-acetylase OafA/YrhL